MESGKPCFSHSSKALWQTQADVSKCTHHFVACSDLNISYETVIQDETQPTGVKTVRVSAITKLG